MINREMIKTDLYEAINGEYLESVEIPSDRTSMGRFVEIDMKVENTLIDDSKNLPLDDESVTEGMKHYLKFYRSIISNTGRDLTSDHPVYETIKSIQSVSTKKELNKLLMKLSEIGNAKLFDMGVEASFKDSTLNILFVDVPSTILPAKDFYLNEEQKTKFTGFYKSVMLRILAKFQIENAETVLSKALSLDERIVEYVRTSEELANYVELFNPVNYETLIAYSDLVDFDYLIKHFIKKDVKHISITQPKFFENMNKLYTMDNLEEIKAYILVRFLYAVSDLFDEELRELKTEYSNAISGVESVPSIEKFAYRKSMGIFSQIVGMYYGKKYFGEEAKKDIYNLVHKIIDKYKVRLGEKEWLTDNTKSKAILKLESMELLLGYPDKIPTVYENIKYLEGKTLYENYTENMKHHILDNFGKYEEPIDRSKWHMPACKVNAYYDPSKNLICFPAAILNEPFYSINQTKSENFGGIGAVIAHEISHAFDNNGANFDEKGNLNNWWAKEDYEAFQELTNKMISQFDGIEIFGGKVNGTLVVSENLADVGGLACAVACAKDEKESSLEEVFANYARIWALKVRSEYGKLLLSTDVHAPAKLRANMEVMNMDEFYEVFDVKEGDKMYRAKEDRIIVW